MPLVQIAISGPTPAPAAIKQLQRESTRLMRDVLHKEPGVTVVSVSHLPAGAVAVGGKPVSPAAWLLGLITAGTNSDAEKAAFIAAAEVMLVEALGERVAPVYVALQALPAGDWGYDGQAQAARRQARLDGGSA